MKNDRWKLISQFQLLKKEDKSSIIMNIDENANQTD
jgi:hypothetical protein